MSWLYSLTSPILYAVYRAYFGLELHNTDNIPLTGAVILASNHASNLDPTGITCGLPRECHFLAKEELLRIPILGVFLKAVNTHPIRRGGGDRGALKQCADILARREMLLIFPEGTRTVDGQLQDAKPGAAMIALQGAAQIVPVYIEGSLAAMPRRAHCPRPRKIRVYYGKPFDPAQLDLPEKGRERYETLSREMMARIAQLKPAPIT